MCVSCTGFVNSVVLQLYCQRSVLYFWYTAIEKWQVYIRVQEHNCILYKFPNSIYNFDDFIRKCWIAFISIWSAYCTLDHFVLTWLLTSSRNQHPGQKHSELNLKNDPEPAEKTILFTAMNTLTLTASRKYISKTLMGSVLSVTVD